jgi:TonB family protein
MKKTLSIICIFISTLSYGQKLSENIIGDWTEIRREQRRGYVFSIGGGFMEPSIELSFFKDSTATFFNPQTPEPKAIVQYLIIGDTLLALINQGYLTIFDIEKITNSEMVIVWRFNKKGKDDDLDQKQHFIRKDRFNKLTPKEKNRMKSASLKDSTYLKEIIARKQKRNNSIQNYENFSEVSPTYPSGDAAMNDFIKNNLHRPKSFTKSGKVLLSFIVDTNGELTNIQIEKSLTTECDNEAIRVIRLMPKWTPGKQNGQKVRVKKLLYITF